MFITQQVSWTTWNIFVASGTPDPAPCAYVAFFANNGDVNDIPTSRAMFCPGSGEPLDLSELKQ